MQQSSELIGAITAALVRAQARLMDTETTLTAEVRPPTSGAQDRPLRSASLVSDPDIVRRILCQQEIATIQSIRVDDATGQIHLATLLAHASGEWISSDWPVCVFKDVGARPRMGKEIDYARRCALFAMVGISSENDLAGPDLAGSAPAALEPQAEGDTQAALTEDKSIHFFLTKKDISTALSGALLEAPDALSADQALLISTEDGLVKENTLLEADASNVGIAYKDRSDRLRSTAELAPEPEMRPSPIESLPVPEQATLTFPKEPARKRSKEHLSFVRGHPCLVCEQLPSDAHHIKFAQPKMLGRKVSDEFTVPLCRMHHQDLHRHGNEKAWWANLQIEPLAIANELWAASQAQSDPIAREPGR